MTKYLQRVWPLRFRNDFCSHFLSVAGTSTWFLTCLETVNLLNPSDATMYLSIGGLVVTLQTNKMTENELTHLSVHMSSIIIIPHTFLTCLRWQLPECLLQQRVDRSSIGFHGNIGTKETRYYFMNDRENWRTAGLAKRYRF